METHQDLLLQWRDARHQLDHAIQHFLDNSNLLNANLPSHSIDPECLESVISEGRLSEIAYPTLQQILAVLSACPALEVLHLFAMSIWVGRPTPTTGFSQCTQGH